MVFGKLNSLMTGSKLEFTVFGPLGIELNFCSQEALRHAELIVNPAHTGGRNVSRI